MAILYLLVLAALSLAVVLARGRPDLARGLYRGARLAAAVPYAVHVRYTWGWVSSYGDPSPRIGVYPGLQAYAAVSAVIILVLLGAAWALVPRAPVATALLPLALGLGYRAVCLPLLDWRAPDLVPLDNVPLVWLLGTGVLATLLLAAAAWLALRGR